MTATVPQQGPPLAGGPTAVRRLGEVYAYTVRDHHTDVPMPDDYVGQSRNQPRRDLQHRGLAPEQDGVVREKPWADQIVSVRIVESGLWSNAELDERERYWITVLAPRLNHDDNLGNPNRIPIYTQRDQRDARDVAKGLEPRDWNGEHGPGLNRPRVSEPVQQRPTLWTRLWATSLSRRVSVWLRTAAKVVAVWLALSAVATGALVALAHAPFDDAAGLAGVGVAAVFGAAMHLTRPRRGGPTNNRRRPR